MDLGVDINTPEGQLLGDVGSLKSQLVESIRRSARVDDTA